MFRIRNGKYGFGATLAGFFIIHWNRYSPFQFVPKCQRISQFNKNVRKYLTHTHAHWVLASAFMFWFSIEMMIRSLYHSVCKTESAWFKEPHQYLYFRILSFLSLWHKGPRGQYWNQINSLQFHVLFQWIQSHCDSFQYSSCLNRTRSCINMLLFCAIYSNHFRLKFISVFVNIVKQKYSVPRNYESTKCHFHQVFDVCCSGMNWRICF